MKYLALLTRLQLLTLTTVENKIPSVSDLVKKPDYDAKMSEMEKIYILLLLIIICS